MKLTKKHAVELVEWVQSLHKKGEFEAIQGMKDSLHIMFNDSDQNKDFVLKEISKLDSSKNVIAYGFYEKELTEKCEFYYSMQERGFIDKKGAMQSILAVDTVLKEKYKLDTILTRSQGNIFSEYMGKLINV